MLLSNDLAAKIALASMCLYWDTKFQIETFNKMTESRPER